jgi:hypothetical protein
MANRKIVVPPGGRIHILRRVPVIQSRKWEKAVKAASHHTSGDSNIWKVGGLFPASRKGTVLTDMVLVRFGPAGGNLLDALAWAFFFGLKRTSPRHIFAIGEHRSGLHRTLGNPLNIVATQACYFKNHLQECLMWWRGERRGTALRLEREGRQGTYFAFVRKSVPDSGKGT